MLVEFIGWLSSGILLITLTQQVRKQWQSHESRGVSSWLFAGQIAASSGFALFSYLLGNWVFVSTNLLLVANAGVGQWVTWRNRRHASPHPGPRRRHAGVNRVCRATQSRS